MHLHLHRMPDQLFLLVLMRIYNIFYHHCLEMFLPQKLLAQFPWLLKNWYLFQMETLFPLHALYVLLQAAMQMFPIWTILLYMPLFSFLFLFYPFYSPFLIWFSFYNPPCIIYPGYLKGVPVNS